jgi:hypothetical protein
MKHKRIIVIVAVLVLVLFGYFIYNYIQQYLPKYSWYEQYSYKSEQPYGLSYLYEILKSSQKTDSFFLVEKPIYQAIDQVESKSAYVFVGSRAIYDSTSISALLNFVSKGNTAFYSSVFPPWEILDTLSYYPGLDYYWYNYDTVATTHFFNKQFADTFTFHYQFRKDSAAYYWRCVDSSYFYDTLFVDNYMPLSQLQNGQINFFSMKYGEGIFYFHTTPLMLTNYHLQGEQGYDYINRIVGYLPNGHVFWDKYSKSPTRLDLNTGAESQGPLKFILSQKSLRMTWYLLLLMVFLFLIFRAKREQQIIPLQNKKMNTSIEFAKATGTLFYNKKNHRILMKEMMNLFSSFVRNKYQIHITKDKQKNIELISKNAEIPRHLVEKIFDLDIRFRFGTGDFKEELISLYKLTNYFYKHCK